MAVGNGKEKLLARLQELHIQFETYDHPAVLTVEAQAKYVGHLGGALSKNLFLKDKKHRYYVVSALSGTNVDLKVMSQRLGLGKGGLRMAPEEALQEILQVPLGCVTPFALINESARAVSFLLDQGFKAHEHCFFHPLSNEMTISINTPDLDKFLDSIGRKPAYVDLEANPTVGKDQPPDLAFLVPSETPTFVSAPEKVTLTQVADNNRTKMEKTLGKPEVDNSLRSGLSKIDVKKVTGTNVGELIDDIINKACSLLINEVNKDSQDQSRIKVETIVDKVSRKIRPDLENSAIMLKNAAYTEGFHAGVRCAVDRGIQSLPSRR
ncbi:ybaK/aminoacyl-tRNA synthetase-associated domain-containing protein isoform X2 [Wolffia australiana]